MPVSKKRKKKGKAVKGSPEHRLQRAGDQLSGVTLQDLINVLAYQEVMQDGDVGPQVVDVETEGLELPTVNDIDFEAPDAQAVIRAVSEASKYKVKENEDER